MRSDKISNLINVSYVRQGEPLGLGHAVLVTKALVGNEPFAVVLGDDVIDASPPALQQMIEVYNRLDAPVLAVERVPESDVSNYGIVDIDPAESLGPTVHRVRDLVEKPPRSEAPSNLAIIGRYLLTPDIYPALEATSEDRTGEIQLTNGLRRLLKSRPIYTCEISGVRHDTGNKLGYLKAMVYFALRRPDLAEPFREYLESLDLGTQSNDKGTTAGADFSCRRLGFRLRLAARLCLALCDGLGLALAFARRLARQLSVFDSPLAASPDLSDGVALRAGTVATFPHVRSR